MVTRADIVMEARRWIGTRYKHQGRSTAGIDCAGLIIKVAHNLGLSTHDETNYARRPDGYAMLRSLNGNAVRVNRPCKPGDIILLSFQDYPQHLAIVSDTGMIHSYALARKVVEHGLDDVWRKRIIHAYEFPGVTD